MGQCTWCRYVQALYTEDIAGQLMAYVASLPAENRTAEGEYNRRLAVCAACARCTNGLCGYCGCFVAVRAAKKDMDCPAPARSKWKI